MWIIGNTVLEDTHTLFWMSSNWVTFPSPVRLPQRALLSTVIMHLWFLRPHIYNVFDACRSITRASGRGLSTHQKHYIRALVVLCTRAPTGASKAHSFGSEWGSYRKGGKERVGRNGGEGKSGKERAGRKGRKVKFSYRTVPTLPRPMLPPSSIPQLGIVSQYKQEIPFKKRKYKDDMCCPPLQFPN